MEQSSIRDFKVIELAFCNPFADYTRFKRNLLSAAVGGE